MKLYLITQDVNNGYDTYDSFVVCAKDEEDAKMVHELDDDELYCKTWVSNIEDIKVKYLGEADESIERGEILGSFNAG